MVETIIDLTERFASIALTGTGGVGKTSIILAVLDDCRIKQRFGDNRSFIRCDRLTASHTHLLRKLSEVIGAGVENPEDLSPLRRYLSSKEMIVVLDNAESILGLLETSAQEIHSIVDELSQFSNICLIITSRISNTLPAHCEIIEIPTLSMEAGHETFYRIYRFGEPSDAINEILRELDFHPLSITLFATVAQQNRWNTRRLTTEWENQRTGVLRTRNLGSLAATVGLSLTSPMFQELGPDAQEVLEVVAFFPQGVKEDNIDGLFPTIPDGPTMFDTFCNLSLTHRSDGSITMLAPLRDYLRPKAPMASPLLRTAKEHYFRRLSVVLAPNEPGFHESQWIMSEDVNVEHLLDVFTSIDADSEDVWNACYHFMDHLFWHKPRLVIVGSKVEALPDSHPSKPYCLKFLSRLFLGVGKWAEQKRVLVHSLGLWRERGNVYWVGSTLSELSDANRKMGLCEEGIQQATEASEIFAWLGDPGRQAASLINLALLLHQDHQLDAAEEAASRAADLSENCNQYVLCHGHNILGNIHRSKGNAEKAIHHFEASLRTASLLNFRDQLFEVHVSLATLYLREDKFDDALIHVEHAKSHAGNKILLLGRAFTISACALFGKNRLKEAKSETLRALAVFEKLGIANLVVLNRGMLEEIEEKIQELDDNGKSSKWRPSSHLFTPLIRTQAPNPDEDFLFFCGTSCKSKNRRSLILSLKDHCYPIPSLPFHCDNIYYPSSCSCCLARRSSVRRVTSACL